VLFVGAPIVSLPCFKVSSRDTLRLGYELSGKCGLSEMVLFVFGLASWQEARVWTAAVFLFYTVFGVLPFAAHRAGGRGEAVVKTPRPAGHDSEGPVESLQALGHHPALLIKDKDGAPLVSWTKPM